MIHRYTLPATGPLIASEADAGELIGEAWGHGAEELVLPLARLAPELFTLANGRLGALLQKLVNYRFRVAIVGDLSAYLAGSAPLRDFVRESNRNGQVIFVADTAALTARLGPDSGAP